MRAAHATASLARRSAAALAALLVMGIGAAHGASQAHPAAAPGAPTASNAVITWQKAAQEAVQVSECMARAEKRVSPSKTPKPSSCAE
jgi:hypothetical protein